MVKNGRHLFNEIPTGYPIPGQTTIHDESESIDIETVPLNGGFLIKTLVLSIDPYLRGKMRKPEAKSYSPAFIIGQPLYNHGIGVVLRSENSALKAGDYVYGLFLFQEYIIKDDPSKFRVIKNEENLPWSVYIGPVGMPGKTAYSAWHEYAQPQKGDTVFITTGAGPVGSFVAQLAKWEGLKVIASAGSDEKVAFMKEIGVDVAFNYKTTNAKEILAKEGPINIYWDNVGGESLEAAIDAAAKGARFLECGMISAYNGDFYPIKNLISIVAKELKIYGFLVSSIEKKYEDQFYKEIPAKIASGQLKYREEVTKGLDKVGEVMAAVQKGTNVAKSVILVAEE